MHRAHKVFGVEKFKALLLAGTFTVLASYVVRLSDSIIAGQMLGADAFAGINLVGPWLSAISFVSGLIATGVGTNYSLAMGRCDVVRARQFFMQGVWSILLMGGALAAACVFGREAYLSFLGADAAPTACAAGYLRWIWPTAILEGFQALLVTLCYADGDAKICTVGYTVVFVANFAASVCGVLLGFGSAGCAMGSLVATISGCLVLSLHFLKRSNTFRPVRHFAFADTGRIVASSFGDAAAFLCDGALFLFLNKFVVMTFGSTYLPVVGVATVLWGFLELFNGAGVAIQPIVTVYYGEGNTKSVRTVMHAAIKFSVLEGLVFMLVLGLFPTCVTRTLGLQDPELVRLSVLTVRLLCGGMIALALAGLFNSYYMFVEKPALAGAITFLCYLVMPIACSASGSLWGLNGVWVGLATGPVAGLAITALIIVSAMGREYFPLLLSRDRESNLHVFNLRLMDDEIVNVSRQVAAVPGVPMRAALMVEEVLMVVKERAGERKLLGEVTLDANGNDLLLTLRDDGPIFDITDADQQISSLRSFLVASMMQVHAGRMNLVTTGFNRNVFRFARIQSS